MGRIPGIQHLLRADIIAGEIAFGSRIRIDELATRYGVSHMPVREALRELHGEGLVVIEPNRGARVRAVDVPFVEDLFDIRAAIETMLARRAAERRTPGDLTSLKRLEEEIEELVARGEFAGIPPVNQDFHRAINRIAGSADAQALVDRHWALASALWQRFGHDTGRFHGVIDDHRHLILALERHDASAAATLMGAHIEKAKHALLARMSREAAPEQAAGA